MNFQSIPRLLVRLKIFLKNHFISLLVIFLIILFIIIKAEWLSYSAYQGGLKTKLTLEEQLDYLQLSIENPGLFSFGEKKSLNRLLSLSNEFREKGDPREAKVLLAIRNGLRTSRSFYQPYNTLLKKINKRLSIITGEKLSKSDKFYHRNSSRFAFSKEPSPLTRFFSFLLFILWIFSIIFFIFKAIKPNMQLNHRHAIVWSTVYFVSFITWAIIIRVG